MPTARLSVVSIVCLAATVPAAHAAAVTVQVQDAAGQPLADAVVLLDPAAGKLPVKPMPQVDISQARRQFSPRVTVVTVGWKNAGTILVPFQTTCRIASVGKS